jgi:hypothetical protein
MRDCNSQKPPSAGDHVVLYEPRALSRSPRLALVCWNTDASPTLIGATFKRADAATSGPLAGASALCQRRNQSARNALLPPTRSKQ